MARDAVSLSRRVLIIGMPWFGVAAAAAGDEALIEPFRSGLERARFPMRKPFVAVYQHGDVTLGFVAAVHATEPRNPTFAAIDRGFDTVQPLRLILEGFPTTSGANPASIVKRVQARDAPDAEAYYRGEPGHAAATALNRGVPFEGGEASDAELLSALKAQGFSAADVYFADILKVLAEDMGAGDFTGPADPRFAAAFDRWSQALARDYGLKAATRAGFDSWYAAMFGTAFQDDNRWAQRGDPAGKDPVSRIARAQSLLRDRFLFGLIQRRVTEHRRVLVVFGGSHLASLWRALAARYGAPVLG